VTDTKYPKDAGQAYLTVRGSDPVTVSPLGFFDEVFPKTLYLLAALRNPHFGEEVLK
jgi:hypothetical protein